MGSVRDAVVVLVPWEVALSRMSSNGCSPTSAERVLALTGDPD